MRSLEHTWNLYRQSFAVLAADPEIVVFPVLSTICALLVAGGFSYPMYLDGTLRTLAGRRATTDIYAQLFVWYYLNYFVMIFFNAALVACANKRLEGGDPTVMDGFRVAFSRIWSIAVWAFVSSTFGILMNALKERRGFWARLLGVTVGVSWTLITYLVVPIFVVEGLSVGNSIRRSQKLLHDNWGQEVAGGFGFGLISLLFTLPPVLVGLAVYPLNHLYAVILGTVFFMAMMIICSAVRGIFTVALYRHACHDRLPQGFGSESIDHLLGRTRAEWGGI
jgi:hypothetical protein